MSDKTKLKKNSINTPCGIVQDIDDRWNSKCIDCKKHPDCRWHSYYPDDVQIYCNFLNCNWGMGLAGSGWCRGSGNCFDKNCQKFDNTNTKREVENGR